MDAFDGQANRSGGGELQLCAARVCASLLLFMLLDALLSALAGRFASGGAPLYAAQAAAYAVSIGAAFAFCAKPGDARAALSRPRAFSPVSAGAAFLAAVFLSSVCGRAVNALLPGAQPAAAPPVGAAGWFWFLLQNAALPALLEELLFRGAIFSRLLPFGRRFAVVVSAALFALSHSEPGTVPGAFLFGLLFGALRLETGSALPGMLLHLLNNAAAAGALALARGDAALYGRLSAAVWIVCGVCAGALAFGCFFKKKSPLPPRAAGEPRWTAFFAGPAGALWLAASAAVIILNTWEGMR